MGIRAEKVALYAAADDAADADNAAGLSTHCLAFLSHAKVEWSHHLQHAYLLLYKYVCSTCYNHLIHLPSKQACEYFCNIHAYATCHTHCAQRAPATLRHCCNNYLQCSLLCLLWLLLLHSICIALIFHCNRCAFVPPTAAYLHIAAHSFIRLSITQRACLLACVLWWQHWWRRLFVHY